jgi:signal peptidase I
MRRPPRFLIELLELMVLTLVFFTAINFAAQVVHVIGISMVPTLSEHDYLLENKLDYRFHGPNRGDIVILRDPSGSTTARGTPRDFIKRVIGLPGERLLIRDSHVYIDGRELQEPYLQAGQVWMVINNWPGSPEAGLVIPADHYFVMGDNRNLSRDSRSFGPVGRDQIEGKAWVRVLPLDRAGSVETRPSLAGGPFRPFL